jgi:hypothetical protein
LIRYVTQWCDDAVREGGFGIEGFVLFGHYSASLPD